MVNYPQIILEEKSHADGQWVVTRSVISNKEFSTKSSEELRKKIKEFRNSYTPEP